MSNFKKILETLSESDKTYDELVNEYHKLTKEYNSVPKSDKRTRGSIQFAIDAAYDKMRRHPKHER